MYVGRTCSASGTPRSTCGVPACARCCPAAQPRQTNPTPAIPYLGAHPTLEMNAPLLRVCGGAETRTRGGALWRRCGTAATQPSSSGSRLAWTIGSIGFFPRGRSTPASRAANPLRRRPRAKAQGPNTRSCRAFPRFIPRCVAYFLIGKRSQLTSVRCTPAIRPMAMPHSCASSRAFDSVTGMLIMCAL